MKLKHTPLEIRKAIKFQTGLTSGDVEFNKLDFREKTVDELYEMGLYGLVILTVSDGSGDVYPVTVGDIYYIKHNRV